MASEYCINKEKREWSLGHDICSGSYKSCKNLIKIGKCEYCGYTPPRCTLRDTLRVQKGCLFCKYAVKKITFNKCAECLAAEGKINYVDVRD